MRMTNIEIMGLESSVVASKYPMSVDINSLDDTITNTVKSLGHQDGGHDQFLTGIRVNFDLTFSNKAWVEAERYRFLEFVSSQSTMHKIQAMDISAHCNSYVDSRIVAICEELKDIYNKNKTKENRLNLLYNIPSGFELTARMTTNYRCLKNIYKQRKTHPLPEWQEFCRQIEELPFAKELMLNVE